jgi:hypothetical protein
LSDHRCEKARRDRGGDALDVLRDAIRRIPASAEGDVWWLEQKLVLARGYYAPDEFDFADAVEVAEVEAAWGGIAGSLPQRELLYMYGMGGHPGGSWADIVRAHDFIRGTRIYSWETDIADVGQQGTFMIAATEKANEEVDAQVVETALSIREPRGLELARSAMSGTLDEMRTVLPRQRIVPLLVDALDEVGDVFVDSDEILGHLVNEAPEHLQPWGMEWKRWLVETYFAPFLSE